MGTWPYPRMLAHRGGGALAPENTLAGLRCALAHGFRAVEFDVMALHDGTLVLMHDIELGRTVRGTGRVADRPAADLVGADAGTWFSPQFAGEPVPTFAEAVAYCLRHGLWMNAEIKPAPGLEMKTGALLAQACAALPAGSVLLSTSSAEALAAARQAAPSVPRALLVGAVPDDWHRELTGVAAVALHVQAQCLTAVQALAIKKAGFGLLCYTVNEPQIARQLLAMGTDALCTDRLDLMPANFADVS